MSEDDGGLSTRRVRIAAVVGGVVLIIGLAVAVATAGGKPASAPSAATPVASAPQSPPSLPAPQNPPPASSAPASSPTPAKPVVRWRGSLTVSGPSAERDLDSVPPRTNDADDDLTGDFVSTALSAESDAQVALLRGGRPGFGRCRDAVSTDGLDELERVNEGDLVCVITSQGRVALLQTRFASQTTASPILRFDVTVWDPPLPG